MRNYGVDQGKQLLIRKLCDLMGRGRGQAISPLYFSKSLRTLSIICAILFALCVSVDEFIQVAKEKYGYNAEQVKNASSITIVCRQ
jgi:hypothetical protein